VKKIKYREAEKRIEKYTFKNNICVYAQRFFFICGQKGRMDVHISKMCVFCCLFLLFISCFEAEGKKIDIFFAER